MNASISDAGIIPDEINGLWCKFSEEAGVSCWFDISDNGGVPENPPGNVLCGDALMGVLSLAAAMEGDVLSMGAVKEESSESSD